MKRLLLLFAFALLASCSPSAPTQPPPDGVVTNPPGDQLPTPPSARDPYLPQPGDSVLLRGAVYLDSVQLLIMESYPPQVSLVLAGSLPDPCYKLRLQVSEPDASNRIMADVYSVTDPSEVCIQILKSFSASVPLAVSGLAAGHYTVWVNGEKVGEFDR
jgi:hypothetical protein